MPSLLGHLSWIFDTCSERKAGQQFAMELDQKYRQTRGYNGHTVRAGTEVVQPVIDAVPDHTQKVTSKFSVDDQRHYLFSPRHLTQWVFGLLRYDFSSGDALVPWMYEARRMFRDVLVRIK